MKEFEAGKTGRSARLSLTYSSDGGGIRAPNAPASVVVKMSRSDFHGVLINRVVKLYRECYFYQNFRNRISSIMNIPQCYYANCSGVSKSFLMILEDVTASKDMLVVADVRKAFARKAGDTTPVDESVTAKVDHVEKAITMLAKLHGQCG